MPSIFILESKASAVIDDEILRRSSWNYNVKTSLGRRFLNIVDRHFPKNNPLHKIINRHTRELRYSCMPNMKTIIS